MKKLVGLLLILILLTSSFAVFASTKVPAIKKTSIITLSQVLQLVSKNYTGEVTKIDLEIDKNIAYYEVDVLSNGTKTELIVDAKTGEIRKSFNEVLDDEEKYIYENFTQDATLKASPDIKSPQASSTPSTPEQSTADKNNDVAISQEKAEKIALDKVGGGKITKSKLDYDNKTAKYEYEIEIIFGNYEYDLDIDANTGSIISYDKDHLYD